MIMISLQCPYCTHSFSKERIPKVLPCGHSTCANCIFKILQQKGYYNCRKCAQNFDPAHVSYALPTNILFFQMVQKLQQFIRQNEWEKGNPKQNEILNNNQNLLRIQQQCLYTFCQRKKFERDGLFQLYCSQECKKNHQQLQFIS